MYVCLCSAFSIIITSRSTNSVIYSSLIVINCSQKWLAVVNLDQPEDYSEPKAVRKLGRQNKYEIKAVLWNPHLVKEDLLASTVSVCGRVCVCVCDTQAVRF